MSVLFHCPACHAVLSSEVLAPNAEFTCSCGGWRVRQGALADFVRSQPAAEDAAQSLYFRERYHERWKREQAAFDRDPRHDRYREICFKKVRAHAVCGARVLEVGSGLGHFLKQLPSDVEAHAVDLSTGNLQYLRETWAEESRGGRLWNASIDRLPFADGQFDVVYAFSVLWYVRNWPQAVGELARVTRRDGLVVFDVYNGYSIWRQWESLYARIRRAVRPVADGIATYCASPAALAKILEGAGFQTSVEGYYALLPTTLPPFGSRGQLAQRSDRLTFGFAHSPLRWTGAKLLFASHRAGGLQ